MEISLESSLHSEDLDAENDLGRSRKFAHCNEDSPKQLFQLFLQFHGPTTLLLQTRASRIRDILTSRDVNEIADTEPGAVQSAIASRSRTSQNVEESRQTQVPTKVPTKLTVASVGKSGDVSFEKQS